MANNERLFVDKLAEVIRRADGNHDMGAGALADAIADSGILFELEEAARAQVAAQVRAALNDPYKRASLQNALNVLSNVDHIISIHEE